MKAKLTETKRFTEAPEGWEVFADGRFIKKDTGKVLYYKRFGNRNGTHIIIKATEDGFVIRLRQETEHHSTNNATLYDAPVGTFDEALSLSDEWIENYPGQLRSGTEYKDK